MKGRCSKTKILNTKIFIDVKIKKPLQMLVFHFFEIHENNKEKMFCKL